MFILFYFVYFVLFFFRLKKLNLLLNSLEQSFQSLKKSSLSRFSQLLKNLKNSESTDTFVKFVLIRNTKEDVKRKLLKPLKKDLEELDAVNFLIYETLFVITFNKLLVLNLENLFKRSLEIGEKINYH